MSSRRFSPLDHLIAGLDDALRTLAGVRSGTGRDAPGRDAGAVLDPEQARESARLMRVNHTGEVCAQALYQGQALTARLGEVRAQMEQAAAEERDHLAWCEQRLAELGSRTSVLNPFFYGGSLMIGALAGAIGDRWSLGFLAETERQVMQHLDDHLQRLPEEDARSRAIVHQMREDEARHAEQAATAGGATLPLPVRLLMQATSRVMTRTTYWV